MLNELFDEILDSEKSFKEKVDRLRTCERTQLVNSPSGARVFTELLYITSDSPHCPCNLSTVTENIEKSQKELDAAKGELETLQGEMLVKSQRLSELKVDVCSQDVLVGVLREQERALRVEKEELEGQLATVNEEADKERSGLYYVHTTTMTWPVVTDL